MLHVSLIAFLQTDAATSTVSLTRDLDVQTEQQEQWRVGARFHVWTSFGKPANDIIGGSLNASHRLNDDWSLTAELYYAAFDHEDPMKKVFGVANLPVADAGIDMIMLSVGAQYHRLKTDDPLDVYVGAGLGLVKLSDGHAEAPGIIDVDVDGGAGVTMHALFGVSYRVWGSMRLVAEARLNYIFASLDVKDNLSGDTGSVDGFEAVGFSAGFEFGF